MLRCIWEPIVKIASYNTPPINVINHVHVHVQKAHVN